jgi:hypothetical protein
LERRSRLFIVPAVKKSLLIQCPINPTCIWRREMTQRKGMRLISVRGKERIQSGRFLPVIIALLLFGTALTGCATMKRPGPGPASGMDVPKDEPTSLQTDPSLPLKDEIAEALRFSDQPVDVVVAFDAEGRIQIFRNKARSGPPIDPKEAGRIRLKGTVVVFETENPHLCLETFGSLMGQKRSC